MVIILLHYAATALYTPPASVSDHKNTKHIHLTSHNLYTDTATFIVAKHSQIYNQQQNTVKFIPQTLQTDMGVWNLEWDELYCKYSGKLCPCGSAYQNILVI